MIMPTVRILFGAVLLLYCAFGSISAKKELRLLHVLSANKFYVPDFDVASTEFQAPKNLSYNYFLENAVDIPNSVKLGLYNLGEHLRTMYGNVIGSLYNDEVMRMQTVGFPVSIIAGELINAGLWPPVEAQIWKDDLAWQPVPFEYTEVDEDALLLGTRCPNFEYDTRKVIQDHYNLSATDKELLQHIRQNGKINVENPIDVLMLHLALENSIQLNQTHPQWVSEIYPSDNLTNMSLAAYDLFSTTTLQKRLNGGSLLKRIIKDSKSYINGTLHKDRRINIYSGDDRNFAGVLKNLNITMHELPRAGDALIFELLQELNQFYIVVNYYQGDIKEQFPFPLSGCELHCPIEKFSELVADFLPENELSLCGSMVHESGKGNANSISISNNFMSFVTLILLYLNTKIC